MKRWTLFYSTVAALLLAFGLAWAQEEGPEEEKTAAETAGPRIEFDQKEADAGVVKRGEEAVLRFTVKNTGQADLNLTKVTAGCACVVSKYDSRIPPGGNAQIEVTMQTKGLRGEVKKAMRVECDDPAQPVTILRLRVVVQAPVDVQPGDLVSIDYKKGLEATQEFILAANEGPPLEVKRVNSSHPDIQVTTLPPEVDEKGKQICKVKVTRAANLPPRAFQSIVRVETNNPEEPALYLRFTGKPLDAVSFLPEKILFPLTAQTPLPLRRSVTFMRQEGQFKVLEATTDDPHLEVTIRPVKPGHVYNVTLTYKGGWPDGNTQGRVVVKMDDPDLPQVEVPFLAAVRLEPEEVVEKTDTEK
jgi:hypothetical protein